ncbi:GNAT family N-acetyltransferase [Aeromonas jandaei]|uniref:GNAT family N-acetyltransferase n=1 Tax=Aeromonas jandaei TaxID=650 RepID=UPI001F43FF9B|nr:GNAT family N-acetyltransferase [Aeromonas jandaei]MCF7720500.1 GNAT family N-acetyltransferase [Aeromonas jandaei]
MALQQRIINSQPAFNLALGGPAALSLSAIRKDAEAVLAADGCYLAIRRQQEVVGIAHLLAHNPFDGHPWIGLLVIDSEMVGKGVGRSAVCLLSHHLARLNPAPVRLCVQLSNPAALSFWLRCGFDLVEKALDEEDRPIAILQNSVA